MEFGLGRTNTGVECVRQRAFSLSEQFYRNLPSGILFPPAREEEARELQSSVKLNGGNKFWAISGNRLESSSRAMHIFHTRRQYSYLSTVIARYLPAGDLSLRKESQIFNSLTFMATTEEEKGPDLNSPNCSTILKNQDSSFVQRKAKYFRRFPGSI